MIITSFQKTASNLALFFHKINLAKFETSVGIPLKFAELDAEFCISLQNSAWVCITYALYFLLRCWSLCRFLHWDTSTLLQVQTSYFANLHICILMFNAEFSISTYKTVSCRILLKFAHLVWNQFGEYFQAINPSWMFWINFWLEPQVWLKNGLTW